MLVPAHELAAALPTSVRPVSSVVCGQEVLKRPKGVVTLINVHLRNSSTIQTGYENRDQSSVETFDSQRMEADRGRFLSTIYLHIDGDTQPARYSFISCTK